MDFFERAHVPKKAASKMENMANEAVKRQLKQMMHAYKKGNNEGILSSSEIKPKYDFDETISISDFSELSGTKEAANAMETATSNASNDLLSSSNVSSKSIADDCNQDDSLDDVTGYGEESKSSSFVDVSASENSSNSFGKSSAVFDWSDTNDSELSIPSSLEMSQSGTDDSEDQEFDADGTLASKILEKLDKKDKACKKRKIQKDHVEPEIMKEVVISDQTLKKREKKKTKKSKRVTENSSTGFFVEEDFSSDIESSYLKKLDEPILEETKKKRKNKKAKQQSQQNVELSDDSFNNDCLDTTSNASSLPFISVSAEDMLSQSFSELLGDYIHPTIRNLPTEKQNIPTSSISSMFPSETMIVKDMIEEEISSLIPEVDEDLAIEDLNLDTDTQEHIEEDIPFDDTIPSEEMSDEISIDEATAPVEDPDTEISANNGHGHAMKGYEGHSNYVILMKYGAELYIHGRVKVTALSGTLDMFGYIFQDSSVDVFAPHCYYAQCLKPVDYSELDDPRLVDKLASAGISRSDINEILSFGQEFTAVILLSKLNARKFDLIDNTFNIDLFSRRSGYAPGFLKKASEILGCSFYVMPPMKTFEKKPIWENVLTSGMKQRSRGIICGGKGTGKSTFLRHYVNHSLPNDPMLLIDLDPGQSEFTIPGCVSATIVDKPLVGPNFTHLKTPERMLNIGIINTMDNAKRYLSAVTEIIAYCRADARLSAMPWVVNTMGLCNDMGLKFMTYIILLLQPTFVFQIDSKALKKRFDYELNSQTVLQLYEDFARDGLFRDVNPYMLQYSFIIARPEENGPVNGNSYGSSLTPRDERYLNVLAYFGQLLKDYSNEGIMDIVPYEVNLSELNIGLNVKIPEGTVTKVINGKIIALCQRAVGDKGQVFTLGDKPLLCHGHGIIRGVDTEQGILYILTPVGFDKLRSVDTLVYSDWMPELRGPERDLPHGTAVPYRTAYTVLQHRKFMDPPRRRFNPLLLLRMTRNS